MICLFKQKTAYEMRISDWSSDVCSSDLYKFPKDSSAKILTSGLLGEQYIGIEPGGDMNNLAAGDKITMTQSAMVLENLISQFLFSKAAEGKEEQKIGRASCRERVCQYV